jgi:hypothetical protein
MWYDIQTDAIFFSECDFVQRPNDCICIALSFFKTFSYVGLITEFEEYTFILVAYCKD